MSVLRIFLVVPLLSGLLLVSCQKAEDTVNAQKFGGEVTLDESVSLAAIYASPEQYQDKEIRVEGTIKQVCQHKGCWIKLADGDKELIVRFKDYGFFLPKDAATSKVIIQGVFSMSPDKHVEEEAKAQAEGKGHVEGGDHDSQMEHAKKGEHGEDKEHSEKMAEIEKPVKSSSYSFTASAVLIYPDTKSES
jgi:hypothetical protein